ncbi:MAG: SdpI family protein [Patescibacteria group bacterium]
MKTSLSRSITFALLVLSFIAGSYFYPRFPEQVVTHWNLVGEADGYSTPFAAAYFLPILSLMLYVVFKLLPKIDPRKDMYAAFKETYNLIVVSVIVFLTIMHLLVGFYGLGYTIPIHIVVPIMVGALFITLGSYFGKIKNNWFVGVRNPWTLSHAKVWDKTHAFSGKLFVIAGVLFIGMAFIPNQYITPLFIAIIAGIIIIPNIYSYIIYGK